MHVEGRAARAGIPVIVTQGENNQKKKKQLLSLDHRQELIQRAPRPSVTYL